MGSPRGAVESKPQQIQNVHPQSAPLSSPGVLILSGTREPLYITPGAHKFLAELDGFTDAIIWSGPALPLAVQHVCTELQYDDKHDQTGTDWNKMQVRHLARTAQGTILIRGYAIFEQRGTQAGRFLILLETVPTESSRSDTSQATGYQFTERQRAILNGLVLGLTNKEIAESLRISIHTVKEYVRQLMIKLHASSRTGIVACVAGLTLPSPKASGHRKSQTAEATVQVV